MKSKKLLALLMVAIFLTGCGEAKEKHVSKTTEIHEEITTENDIKEETDDILQGADIVTEEQSAVETTLVEPVQMAEKKTESKQAETRRTTVAPAVATPVSSEPIVTSEPETKECEHDWKKEEVYYDIFKKMTFGCNGCGLALFEWSGDKSSVEHIENLYFHEPCPTDRFPEPCCGGGYHSESVTIGFCGFCTLSADNPDGRVAYRQCMWTENGKRCSKNEVTGTYEKVGYDQNYFMYYDSCKCQKNAIFVNGNDDENAGKGIIFGKEKCTICGVYKDN